MRGLERAAVVTGLLSIFAAAPAAAQQTATKAAPPAAEEPLRLEREVFVYPLEGRRDPFESLANRDDLGPRFEELSLGGIIYNPDGGSVALLTTSDGRIYRVRRGDVVGNARVLDISQNRVVFAVETFGVVRQETLERKKREGVDG
ncbi:MAG TPA: hypothetical protein VF212_08040 [Longimicrobiales bacterium]